MITRHHRTAASTSQAVYSPCDNYRYSLTRAWDAAAPRVLFVMLNPSTATELRNDPTVERCERRARALGCGAFRVVNIFAWRATDPGALRQVADPVGPRNDTTIHDSVTDWIGADDMIVAAWGNHGAHLDRGRAVAGVLALSQRRLFSFGLTKAGQPRHPLYVGYAITPECWRPAALTISSSFAP